MENAIANINAVLATVTEPWSPRIVATVNDWDVRLAKFEGAFVWHAHHDTDELFIVLDGSVDIHLRERDTKRVVHLGRHDVFVVPRGTEHCPQSSDGASVLLLEPSGTLTTGDHDGDLPAGIAPTTGLPAPRGR